MCVRAWVMGVRVWVCVCMCVCACLRARRRGVDLAAYFFHVNVFEECSLLPHASIRPLTHRLIYGDDNVLSLPFSGGWIVKSLRQGGLPSKSSLVISPGVMLLGLNVGSERHIAEFAKTFLQLVTARTLLLQLQEKQHIHK